MTEPQLLSPDRERTSQEHLAVCRLELEMERQQLALERAELAAEREEVAAQRLRLAVEVSRAAPQSESTGGPQTEKEPATPTEHAHDDASDEDVFARLRGLSVLKEEGVQEEVPASEPAEDETEQTVAESEPPSVEVQQAPPAEPVAAVEAPPAVKEHEPEESIDDYMARLFARLNGGRGGAPAEPKPTPTPEPQASAPAATMTSALSAENTVTESVSEPVVEAPREPLTMIPRRAAPEKQIDLSAMRQLANSTASSAIGASQRRQRTTSATIKLGAAAALGIFGVAAMALASSGWIQGAKAPMFGFGAVLVVAGALWLLQGLGLLMLAWGGGKPASAAAKGKGEAKAAEDAAK